MASRKKSDDAKEEVRRARADLREDIAALDHHLHVDIPARIKRKAPVLAGGAAVAATAVAAVAVARRRRKKTAPKPKGRKR